MPDARARLVAISVVLVKKFGHSICTPCGGHCCKGCGNNKGYFDSLHEFEEAKRKYGFDHSLPNIRGHRGLGFLGEHGCKIPREERSNTCLMFWCCDVVAKMNKKERTLNMKGYKLSWDMRAVAGSK